MQRMTITQCKGPSSTAAIPAEDHATNRVSVLFFSDLNVGAVQQGVRYRVYVDSEGRHQIGNQSEQELLAIMRSVYLDYCRNLPYDYVGQVRALNGRVIAYAVPKIVSELDMRMHYIRDINTPPAVLQPAVATNVTGAKQERAAFWPS
jgi:hypothetical protein